MAQEAKEGTVREKVPWIPIILLTAISSVAGSIVYLLLTPSGSAFQCTYNWGMCSRPTMLTVMPFILITLAYPFRKLFKISASHLTSLYAVGIAICYTAIGGSEAAYFVPLGMAKTVLFTTGTVRAAMGSWWWAPPYDVVEATMTGGVPVNWAAWAGPIAFWITLYFSLFLFGSGISLIFRRRWINIDQVPFPLVTATYEVVRSVDVNRPAERSLKPLIIGIIIGLFFEIPIFLQSILPWFPDIYGWRTLTCQGGRINLCPTSSVIPQSIIGLATVTKDPVAFGLFFLAPLSVSFNVWFWTLVMMVLEQIAYYMGYYTGILSEAGSCRVLGYTGGPSLEQGPPFYWGSVSSIGGAIAIAAMLLYNSRSYLRQTLKEARTPGSSLSKEEIGAEATSYRTAYLLLAAGVVSIILWQMAAGIEFFASISILIFTVFVGGLVGFYTYAQTGFLAISNERAAITWFPVLVRWGGNVPNWDSNVIMTSFVTQSMDNASILMHFPFQLMPLKMASLTGTSSRNAFLSTVVALLVAVPLIIMTKTWMGSIFGFEKVEPHVTCDVETICSVKTVGTATLPMIAGPAAIGFVITLALAMLHSRFIWFPFEPLGFVIATSIAGTWWGVWTAFLGAWIMKTIVLRIGGSKLYERCIPIVGGFVVAVVMTIFVGSLILSVRFFIPF